MRRPDTFGAQLVGQAVGAAVEFRPADLPPRRRGGGKLDEGDLVPIVTGVSRQQFRDIQGLLKVTSNTCFSILPIGLQTGIVVVALAYL